MQPNRSIKTRAGQDDVQIGARIRTARVDASLSQSALGHALGVSFQQVQKWEMGQNRVTASTLVKIARITEKPVAFLLVDLIGENDWNVSGSLLASLDALNEDERLFLMDYSAVPTRYRKCIREITRGLGETETV